MQTRRIMGLALIVAVAQVAAAQALTIAVNTTADDTIVNGNCTLRQAVIAANTDTAIDACPAGSGADIVSLPAGIYTLTIPPAGGDPAATGDLNLTDDVTIEGAGRLNTVIDGNATDRVITIDAGVTAAITGVTIQNGFEDDFVNAEGGGIRNDGTLSIIGCTVQLNKAVGVAAQGGGIANLGSLSLTDSVVTGNVAEGSFAGIAGGVYSFGPLTVTDSTVSNNAAVATVAFDQPLVAAAGGIASHGPGTIIDSTIADNIAIATRGFNDTASAGGISHGEDSLTIVGSTISGNTAEIGGNGQVHGGGIAALGALTLVNSTISDNRTQISGPMIAGLGGALHLRGATTISNCTIALNQSLFGAVATAEDPTVTFRNTVLSDNASENCDTSAPSGTIVSDAFNLEDGDSCGFSGSDLVNADPLLGPLQNNGGPTLTHLPAMGSPARQGGSPAPPGSGGNACEATDQVGVVRPQFGRCDIGSVEVRNPDACAEAPLLGCDLPGKSFLLIKDKLADGAGNGDKLAWKWLKGPPTEQQDFGDPTTTAAYTLCVYAGTAAVLRAEVPAGGICDGAPCWSAISDKGYKRKDNAASSSGISRTLLKGSDSAKSKMIFKGKGAALDVAPATLPIAVPAGTAALTVQVSHSDNDNCWQATFASTAVTSNSETVFKAKTP